MEPETETQKYDRLHNPTRVLALSDGVFAIILTLLVLEIHVPELAGGQTLREALEQVKPSFIAFLISFVVVAVAWAGHRDLFSMICRTDRTIVWLNLLYLLPLSLIPFGASLIARYQSEPVALRMYGTILLAIALTRLVIWVYGTGRLHLLFTPIDPRSRWAGVVVTSVTGGAYAIAILIAGFAPTACLVIYGLVPVVYFVAISLTRKYSPPGAAERDFT